MNKKRLLYYVLSRLLASFAACLAATDDLTLATIGQICNNNGDCLGDNEFCEIQNRVDAPCTSGRCACFDGFVFRAGSCVKKALIYNLNDNCGRTIGEVITVQNAGCYSYKVQCRPGYVSQGSNSCLLRESCSSMDPQCPLDMICDAKEGRCVCVHNTHLFDKQLQKCVRREFGDPCSTDEECQVEGNSWQGFTYSTGICVASVCVCRDKTAHVSYFDAATYSLKKKTICITDGGQLNASLHARCTVDPVFWSDRDDTSVCAEDNVCVQCPEDVKNLGLRAAYSGFCRRPLSLGEDSSHSSYTPYPLPTTTAQPSFWTFIPSDVVEVTSPGMPVAFFPCEVPKISYGKIMTLSGTEADRTIIPGTQIIVLCTSGYMVKYGAYRATCLIDGHFSEQLGVCHPRQTTAFQPCPLPMVRNGALAMDYSKMIGSNSVASGTSIQVICPAGYEVRSGKSDGVCLETGTWSAVVGDCLPTITQPNK